MENTAQQKFRNDLGCLFDWVGIINNEKKARVKQPVTKPSPIDSKASLKQFLSLVQVPITEAELSILHEAINPGNKNPTLTKEDLFKCFSPEQQPKRRNSRQLKQALKYLADGGDSIKVTDLKQLLTTYSNYPTIADSLISQLSECMVDGKLEVAKVIQFFQ